jgi:hypothetical protein
MNPLFFLLFLTPIQTVLWHQTRVCSFSPALSSCIFLSLLTFLLFALTPSQKVILTDEYLTSKAQSSHSKRVVSHQNYFPSILHHHKTPILHKSNQVDSIKKKSPGDVHLKRKGQCKKSEYLKRGCFLHL